MAIVIKNLEIVLEVNSDANENGTKAEVKSSSAEVKEITTPAEQQEKEKEDCSEEQQLTGKLESQVEEIITQITDLIERRERRY